MKAAAAFALVAVAAVTAGSVFYLLARPRSVSPGAVQIAPVALYAASFRNPGGGADSIGRFSGRPLVLNFWATWCAPCREEMPAFERVQRRLGSRVQFVGLSQDDPAKVRDFAARLGLSYPLWTGGDEVMELSSRLGNGARVLPFTVLIDSTGHVIEQRLGAYKEPELEAALAPIVR